MAANPSTPLASAALGAEPARVSAQPVLGVPLALTDYERTLDWIDETVARRARGYICVAAVHTVMAFQEDPELQRAVLDSNLTVPDGQPLVWAMNLLGHNLPSRVYGPDLMERACERAARTGLRFFLYGGGPPPPPVLPEGRPPRRPRPPPPRAPPPPLRRPPPPRAAP